MTLEHQEDFSPHIAVKVEADYTLEPASEIIQQKQADLQIEFAKLNQLKNDFLNTTTHELRTPLSNMRLAIQMLDLLLRREGLLTVEQEKVGTHPARISDYLRVLSDECDQEIDLVNDLLTLQRLEAETQSLLPMQLPLQDWMSQMIAPFAEQIASQQQRLHLDIPSDLPPLTTDFMLLDRLLSELLHNACKFTPPGEQITVAVSALAGRVQIQVVNSGVGIPKDELTQVFDKFYRIPTDDPWKHSGTGVGLALAKALVLYLGGTIAVESHSEQTAFTIELPCQESRVITSTDMLMGYVAYYLSRGKAVLSPHQGLLPFEGEVYQYCGYHRDFLDFWQRLQQRQDFPELSLQGDDHAFRQFLGGQCTVTECARCRLPIPTEAGHVYSTPSCWLCKGPVKQESTQKDPLVPSVDREASTTQVVLIGDRCYPDSPIEASLASNGFEVTFIADPHAVSLESLPPTVDLVLIHADISEVEAQTWAKAFSCHSQLQGVQIVALSSKNRFSLPWTERRLDVEDYLLSPTGGMSLADRLRQLPQQPGTGDLCQLHWFPR